MCARKAGSHQNMRLQEMPVISITKIQREGSATPSRRPELSSMADDYARHALSQRAAFEATHPAVMAAAGRLASEPVLRVADLGFLGLVAPGWWSRASGQGTLSRPMP